MRIPPLEIFMVGDPNTITISSENVKGQPSEITIQKEQVDILIKWLQDWKRNF